MAEGDDPLPSTRDRKPQAQQFGHETIIIKTGEGGKHESCVHRELLRFYSGYFRTAFKGNWAEVQTGTFVLDNEDPEIFTRFVFWLYTGSAFGDNTEPSFTSIVKLWILADRRDVPLLKNEMINSLHTQIVKEWRLPTDQLRLVYEETVEDCVLRKMMVYTIASITGEGSEHGSWKRYWPLDALWDLSKLMLRADRVPKLGKAEYSQVKMCPEFHVHEEGVTCKD